MRDLLPEDEDSWLECCYAIADIFLDSPFEEAEVECTAKKLASSRFSLQQLDEMYKMDVAPLLFGNLLLVAGVWGCFNRESLYADLKALKASREGRTPSYVFPLFRIAIERLQTAMTLGDWRKVLAHTGALRDGTADL